MEHALTAAGPDGLIHPVDDGPYAHMNLDHYFASWFERYARSFSGTIAGGTSEIQRNIIATAGARSAAALNAVTSAVTTLAIERPQPGIVVLQLNRPEQLNAINQVDARRARPAPSPRLGADAEPSTSSC